jgi:hypothetical protein
LVHSSEVLAASGCRGYDGLVTGEYLEVVGGSATGERLPLDREITIGRSSRGLAALGGDTEISRQHAKIARNADSRLYIADLGSTNGTFVNGTRITGSVWLSPGDEVTVGKSSLRVQAADQPVGATIPAPTSPGGARPAAPPVAAGTREMSGKPMMSERVQRRFQKKAESMLEPGERVKLVVFNLTIPALAYLFFGGLLLLPYVIQKYSVAVVTERHVYVFRASLFGKPTRVLLKAPLGSVDAHVGGDAVVGRYLMVGEHKLWLAYAPKLQRRARAAVTAASGQGLEPEVPRS